MTIEQPSIEPADPEYVRTLTPERMGAEHLRARSATLFYFVSNVARELGMSPADLRDHFDDAPFLSQLIQTPLGNAASITLPLSLADVVRDRERAVWHAQAAVRMARAMGAEHISLSGMLAASLDYGSLLGAPDGLLTTGHATTAASILKSVAAALAAAARAWADEAVAVLGVGSIGQTTAIAALAALGLPRRLVLADLDGKEADVQAFADRLREHHPGLDVSFAAANRAGDAALHRSGVVIGCTSAPQVLRIEALRPGCIVVDDSVPHCFDVDRAFARVAGAADVLLANGGIVRFPDPFPTALYAPPLLHASMRWPAGMIQGTTLTSCVLSPLLMSVDPRLPATLGKGARASTVLSNAAAMDRLGVTAPPLACGGRFPSPEYLAGFARRFGARTSR